jgi:hypothetical protein
MMCVSMSAAGMHTTLMSDHSRLQAAGGLRPAAAGLRLEHTAARALRLPLLLLSFRPPARLLWQPAAAPLHHPAGQQLRAKASTTTNKQYPRS